MMMSWYLNWSKDPALTQQLLSVAIKAIFVLVIAAALSSLLKQASAAARHFVWVLAIAGVLALPLLTMGLPVWQIAILPSDSPAPGVAAQLKPQAPSKAQIEPRVAPSVFHHKNGGNGETDVANKSTFANSIETSITNQTRVEWPQLVLGIWLSVTLLIIIRLLIGTTSIWWIARSAERINDTHWLNTVNDIAWQIGLMRPVQLLKTQRLSMPVTCGVINSSILLPADADEWPEERRQVVLVHELAHVKRRDCLTQMFAQVACAVYWFNPLVWLASRQLRIERERACDDQVIHIGTKASEYASHLLEMARTFHSSKCSSLAAVAIARRSELEGRLLAILDPGLKRRGLKRSAAASVCALIVFLVLPLSTIRLTARAQNSSIETLAVSLAETSAGVASRPDQGIQPAQPAQPAQLPQTEQPSQAGQPPQSEEPAGSSGNQPVEQSTNDQNPNSVKQQADKSGAIQALREALKDEDQGVRQNALNALTQIGDPEAVGPLIEALKDQNWRIRAKAANGLGLHGGTRSADALLGALRDTDFHVREQAAWGLGLAGDRSSIEPLINALTDENAEVREKSAWALGLKGDRSSVDPLISALKDSNAKVRAMSAWALGLKGDTRAAASLKELLKDSDTDVRKKAAWALGMLLMKAADSFVGDRDSDNDDEKSDQEARGIGGSAGVGSGIARGFRGPVFSRSGNVTADATAVGAGVGAGAGDASNRAKIRNKPKQQ
jgi:beta-lactamase regulating signal transducer with metallopeptidase domain